MGGLVQFAIEIAQQLEAANPQDLDRCAQLRLTHRSQRRYSWIIPILSVPAALTSRRGHEMGFDMLGGGFREYAAKTQRLVIGMRQDGQ
jgi:hypothetical protein